MKLHGSRGSEKEWEYSVLSKLRGIISRNLKILCSFLSSFFLRYFCLDAGFFFLPANDVWIFLTSQWKVQTETLLFLKRKHWSNIYFNKQSLYIFFLKQALSATLPNFSVRTAAYISLLNILIRFIYIFCQCRASNQDRLIFLIKLLPLG